MDHGERKKIFSLATGGGVSRLTLSEVQLWLSCYFSYSSWESASDTRIKRVELLASSSDSNL